MHPVFEVLSVSLSHSVSVLMMFLKHLMVLLIVKSSWRKKRFSSQIDRVFTWKSSVVVAQMVHVELASFELELFEPLLCIASSLWLRRGNIS